MIYSAGCPAMLGFAGVALLPSAPWHAAQTWLAICLGLREIGLRRPAPAQVPAGSAANVPANGGQQQHASHRVTPRGNGGEPARLGCSPRNAESMVQKRRIVTESPSPAKAGPRVATDAPERDRSIRCSRREFVLSVATTRSCRRRGRRRSRSPAARTPASRARSTRSPTGRGSRSRAGRPGARSRSTSSGCAAARCSPTCRATATPRCRATLKRDWQGFLGRYVATRQSLVGLVLVVDARHGLRRLDRGAARRAISPSGRPVLVLATKMDKLAASAQREARRAIARDVAAAFPVHAAQVTSCRSRRRAASASRRRKPCSRNGCARVRVRRGTDRAPGRRQKKRPRDQGE